MIYHNAMAQYLVFVFPFQEFFCRRTVSFLETVVEDPRSPEVKTSQWTSLTILDLRFNGLTEIDSSMVSFVLV